MAALLSSPHLTFPPLSRPPNQPGSSSSSTVSVAWCSPLSVSGGITHAGTAQHLSLAPHPPSIFHPMVVVVAAQRSAAQLPRSVLSRGNITSLLPSPSSHSPSFSPPRPQLSIPPLPPSSPSSSSILFHIPPCYPTPSSPAPLVLASTLPPTTWFSTPSLHSYVFSAPHLLTLHSSSTQASTPYSPRHPPVHSHVPARTPFSPSTPSLVHSVPHPP